ncbi:hypothetical protein LSA03_15320 [Pediococcus argentinicus]|nr:hypothetical protein LSA03_15320 [Pediococcus argentinicus]
MLKASKCMSLLTLRHCFENVRLFVDITEFAMFNVIEKCFSFTLLRRIILWLKLTINI